jgi:tight adherence protein B
MSRRRALAALAAGVLAVAIAAGAVAQETAGLRIEAVDARSFPVVEVLVTPPPDLYGAVPDSVVLLENGSSRPATASLLAADPLQVLLVVDISGSMRGAALEAAKVAAVGFLAALPPTTRTAVMGFTATPGPAGDFSDDPADAAAALRGLEARGETALYDAVAAAIDALAATGGGRPFIVLLSDGGDTASTLTLAEAVERLGASDVRFYAVELQTDESDPASLQALADMGAGRIVSAEDPAALAAMYDLIASELVNQLVIGYTSAAGGPTDLSITISHRGVSAAATASITLPGTGVTPTTTTIPTTTTTRPGQQTGAVTTTTLAPSPPAPHVATGPGLLGAPWVLPVGLVATFLAALTVLALTLWPVDRPKNQWVTTVRERFTPSGGLLTRVTNRAKGVAEAALTRSGRRSGLSQALDSAGVHLAAGEFVILSLSAGVVGASLGALLFRLPGSLILGTMGLVVPRLLVNRSGRKRRAAFAAQLDGTLQLMSGSMRAGYGLLQAVNNISTEAAAPAGAEFGRIVMETRLGRDLVESLDALADRMDSDDFRWVAQAIDIQRSVGGDLVSILDTVGETIRERNQIRRQIHSLSAEGRMSAYILISLPFFLTAIISLIRPEFIAPLWTTTIGRVAVAIACLLMLAGSLWIRRIIRLKF